MKELVCLCLALKALLTITLEENGLKIEIIPKEKPSITVENITDFDREVDNIFRFYGVEK